MTYREELSDAVLEAFALLCVQPRQRLYLCASSRLQVEPPESQSHIGAANVPDQSWELVVFNAHWSSGFLPCLLPEVRCRKAAQGAASSSQEELLILWKST